MDITNRVQRQSAIDWALRIRKIAEEQQNVATVEAINAAIEHFREEKTTLAIVGKHKRGKSTLINALLGQPDDLVAPIGKLPATNVIARYVGIAAGDHDTQEKATVHFRPRPGADDGRPALPESQTIGLADVGSYATEEQNPTNHKGVAFINVQARFPNADPGVVLLDTPGVGFDTHHDEMVYGVLGTADGVIFLVTARDPLNQEEIAVLKGLGAAAIARVFFVVNKIDASPPQAIAEGIAHNDRVLRDAGINVGGRFYRISAKQAFQGDMAGSGIAALVNDIRAYVAEARGNQQIGYFTARVRALAGPLLRSLEMQVSQASDQAIARQLDDLAAEERRLAQVQAIPEHEFVNSWRAVIDDFAGRVERARREVQEEFIKEAGSTKLLEVKTQRERLPGCIIARLEKRLEPDAELLSAKLREITLHYGQELAPIRLKLSGKATFVPVPDDPMKKGWTYGGLGLLSSLGLTWGTGTLSASLWAATQAAAATFSFLNPVSWIASAGATAGTTAMAAIATPGLAFLGGPVATGAAILGIGAVAVNWKRSLEKNRDTLPAAIRDFLGDVMDAFRAVQLQDLREAGARMVKELRATAQQETAKLRARLQGIQAHRPSEADLLTLQTCHTQLTTLLDPMPLLPASPGSPVASSLPAALPPAPATSKPQPSKTAPRRSAARKPRKPAKMPRGRR